MTMENYPMLDALAVAWLHLTGEQRSAETGVAATHIALHLALAHPEQVAAIVAMLDGEELISDEASDGTPGASRFLSEVIWRRIAPLLPVAATEAGA